MKILFVTHHYPNYVPDLLLHGLRKISGPDVVDYPKKECLYKGVLGLGICPDDQCCPNWFPSDYGQIDREDIWRKVKTGYFKYIVCDCRAFEWFIHSLSELPKGLVIIDGEDMPVKIPAGKYAICRRETDGSDLSIPLPMALPEEILYWIIRYDNLPKEYTIGFLGSTHDDERKRLVEAIARLYPGSLLKATGVPSDINCSPDGRFGRNDYYKKLQGCKVVLSLPGAGYDTFRFWENAASNALHVSFRMPLYIPYDFEEGRHILRFTNLDELTRIIDRVLEGKIRRDEIIREGRHKLVNYHLTTKRAQYFINKIEDVF